MALPLESPPAIEVLFFGGRDPSPGPNRPKEWSRNLSCERWDAVAGSHRYPGEIKPPPPRGGYVERFTMVCREPMLRPGLRSPLDGALLGALQTSTVALVDAAASLRPDLAGSTWLVEVFVPSPPVAAKLAFATKNALMGRGLSVSDRTPLLAAGDVEVLTRMPPDEAYPAACARYFATGSLSNSDALLAVVSRDPRETIVHAGICVAGTWTWLR